MVPCVPPKCFYSKKKDKCVKPNPYIETLSWCKRNNIKYQNCRKLYYDDKKKASHEACDRYKERLHYVRPMEAYSLDEKVQSRRLSTNVKIVPKTSPRATRAKHMFKTSKTSNSQQHIFVKDIYDKKTEKSLKEYSSINTLKIERAFEKLKALRIRRFLKKHLLVKYFSLEMRVKYYKYVRHFLQKMNKDACIKPKLFKKKKTRSVVKGYTIDDIIDLEMQIGADSVYGVVYKTSVKNMLGRAPIATKLMQKYDSGNRNEIEINGRISENILGKELSRHFLFSYKTFECTNWLDNKDVPSLIKDEEYFASMQELAHGDVISLCSNRGFLENEELVLNIACQCLLSIATFHKMGLVHNDTHWGNFLYHIMEDNKGYYHYVINGKNYYLKNCGYNIMLCDFGMATAYTPDKYSAANVDYRKILEAFQNKTIGAAKWGKFSSVPNEKISNFMKNVISHIFRLMVTKNEDRMIEEILVDFLNTPVRGILMNVKPPNEKIINTKPFIIDDSLRTLF
jgi:hypothetical protein